MVLELNYLYLKIFHLKYFFFRYIIVQRDLLNPYIHLSILPIKKINRSITSRQSNKSHFKVRQMLVPCFEQWTTLKVQEIFLIILAHLLDFLHLNIQVSHSLPLFTSIWLALARIIRQGLPLSSLVFSWRNNFKENAMMLHVLFMESWPQNSLSMILCLDLCLQVCSLPSA